jgi:hypothetical protein
VAHAYNPCYSGGRNQEHSSKPYWANSSQDLISKKNPSQKRAVEYKVEALSSSPSAAKKKVIAMHKLSTKLI